MIFGTHNKSNILIMNILIGTDGLDPKLKIFEIWSQNWNFLQFLWNLALEQMEHDNYEYNTPQCLERLRDYWLRLIVVSEWLYRL